MIDWEEYESDYWNFLTPGEDFGNLNSDEALDIAERVSFSVLLEIIDNENVIENEFEEQKFNPDPVDTILVMKSTKNKYLSKRVRSQNRKGKNRNDNCGCCRINNGMTKKLRREIMSFCPASHYNKRRKSDNWE